MNNKKKTKFKVLYLSNQRDYYGGEICLERLITHNPFVEAIVLLPKGPFADRLRNRGINVKIDDNMTKLDRRDSNFWFLKLLKYPLTLKTLLPLIKKENIDLIVANGLGAVPYGVIASLITKKKVIWVHHHPVLTPDTFEFRLAPLLAKASTRIIAVSEIVRNSLIKTGIPENKVLTIYNGLDTEEFNPNLYEPGFLREKYFIQSDTVLLGLIGAITWQKGFHVAIEAVRMLKYNGLSHKDFLCFFIGGLFGGSKQDAEYKEKLERDIYESKLEDLIFFTGKIANITPVYRDLDVVLNCSIKQESFGTTIYEGMSMEKIVVATNVGGSPEIIDSGINGFLVPPNDPVALAKLLKEIIINYKSYENIRKKAREKVKNRFSIDNMVSNYNEVYAEVLKKTYALSCG